MCFWNERNFGKIEDLAHVIVPDAKILEMGHFNIIQMRFNRFFVLGENAFMLLWSHANSSKIHICYFWEPISKKSWTKTPFIKHINN